MSSVASRISGRQVLAVFARARVNEWTSIALLFVGIYICLLLIWLWFFGHHWGPAFPKPRTMFVLFIGTLPVWSALLALRQWRRLRRTQVQVDRMQAQQLRDDNARTSQITENQFQRRLLFAFGTLAVCSSFLVASYGTYEDSVNRSELDSRLRYTSPNAVWSGGQPVFIAAIFHDNAKVLPHWTREILRVIQFLGKDMAYVSLVESYSTDETAQLLRDFEATLTKMKVPHQILVGDTSIARPSKIVSNKERIEFLAATRNLGLEPLRRPEMRDFASSGRVLFSNDVFVTAEAVVELLNTRNGEYDMACGTDFDDFGLYDIWVTRDRLGGLVAGVWPYLLEPSGKKAIENNEPAEVFSCWNGIVAFRAEPFTAPQLRLGDKSHLSTQPLYPPLPSSHPGYATGRATPPRSAPALQFRSSAPDECFSSESFLLGYDLRRQFGLDKIYLNPRVVTAYHLRFFFWNNYVLRHWIVRWWMRNVEAGRNLHQARITLSKLGPAGVTLWDGGACHGTWEE